MKLLCLLFTIFALVTSGCTTPVHHVDQRYSPVMAVQNDSILSPTEQGYWAVHDFDWDWEVTVCCDRGKTYLKEFTGSSSKRLNDYKVFANGLVEPDLINFYKCRKGVSWERKFQRYAGHDYIDGVAVYHIQRNVFVKLN